VVTVADDRIDIYRPCRVDPAVPIEDTVGAIVDLIRAGYVGGAGLSEVAQDTVRRAHRVHCIVDVQIEYSVISREPERRHLPALNELGIGMTTYGGLSRGLLSGSCPMTATDLRAHPPRFRRQNLERNARLGDALPRLADNKGAFRAVGVSLTAAEVADIEAVVPADAVAGSRYGEAQMRTLDSER
jgi:aryl-alcohol dehydrogenase-like predicted oxidoreductase